MPDAEPALPSPAQDEEETPAIPAEVEEATSGSGETEEPGGNDEPPPEATALISVAELERAHAQMIGGTDSREAADKSVDDSAAETETQPGELSSELEEAFSLDEATSPAEHPDEESAQDPPADEDDVTTDPGLSTSTTSTAMITSENASVYSGRILTRLAAASARCTR